MKYLKDYQLEEKFEGSNLISLYRMLAEMEDKKRLRLKRFKDEPNGFLLKYEDGGRTCKICEKGLRGDECWWRPGGISCDNCHNNILKEAISEELLDNDKLWFASRHIQYEFDMHHATVAKHIRNGKLVGKDLVNEEGVKYYTIFLSQDNVRFFTEHKRVNEDRKRFALADNEGNAFYL